MRLRGLALYPLIFAGLFVLAATTLSGEILTQFIIGQKLSVRVLGILGCLAAVSLFERGDRLHSAWRWLLIGLVLILARDVIAQVVPRSDLRSHFLIVLGVGFNFLSLTGIWLLAGVWREASMDWAAERRTRWWLTVAAAVVALAAAGPSAWRHGQALLAGAELTGLVMFVSAVVDIVSLCLIAPLAATAWSLRGGLFSWPFALLAASQVAWVFYDAAAFLAPGPGGFPWGDLFRGLAGNYLAAAGWAQSRVVREVRGLG
jgi:hypothetical protein